MSEQDIIDRLRGVELATPLPPVIRVFHVRDPKYSYAFVRICDHDRVLVVDDGNQKDRPHYSSLLTFAVNDLVNVALFEEETLKSHESPLPPFS